MNCTALNDCTSYPVESFKDSKWLPIQLGSKEMKRELFGEASVTRRMSMLLAATYFKTR